MFFLPSQLQNSGLDLPADPGSESGTGAGIQSFQEYLDPRLRGGDIFRGVLRSALLSLFSLFAFCTVDAQAATAMVVGRSIEIVIPNGYCELGNHPADAEVVRQYRRELGHSNQIVGLFANCGELEKGRNGKGFKLDHYGQILANTPEGKLRVFKGVTRAEFIQKMSGLRNFGYDLKEAEARIKQLLPRVQSQEYLGILGTDPNGIYTGFLLKRADDHGKPYAVVAIMGMTLVKELSMSLNLSQAFKKSSDFRGLLLRQQAAMAGFVRANHE